YYHGGPIIYAQKVAAIYWSTRTIYPGGPAPGTQGPGSGDGSLVGFFMSHLGGSPYYNINTTYDDGAGTHIQNSVTYTQYWEVNTLAHETEETNTDEDLNAWYDNAGNENADKCAWDFGATYTTSNGSTANMQVGGSDFLVQQNWVNANGGGCRLSW